MTHTERKENWVKQAEPALRHIYKLSPDDYIRFNREKTRRNGQADIVIFDRQNFTKIYLKVYCSYEQCFYSVALDQYKRITAKNPLNPSKFEADCLDGVILANNKIFTIVTLKELEAAGKFQKTVPIVALKELEGTDELQETVSAIINVCFQPEQFKCYYYDGKVFDENQEPEIISEKKTIPKDSFLMSDHRLGKQFVIIDNDSLKGGGNGCPRLQDINDFTMYVWGETTDNNVAAKAAFNKMVRRYIKKMQEYFENGYQLEPLNGTWNQRTLNVFIFPLEMINITSANGKVDLTPFFQYQNGHNRKVNKTANMKDYQKTYQKNYYEKHKKQA